MSGNFEWHTDDEWDQFGQDDDSAESPRRSLRNWLIIGAIAIVGIVIGGYFVAQRTTQRIEEVTAFTEENVRSSYRLVERAVANNDLELFNSLLSGRDEAWTDARQRLFIEGALFDRGALGLHLLDERAEITEVELAPELRSAELTTQRSFAIDVGNGLTETVVLEQLYTFRRGSDNFIYAPPDISFWGDQSSIGGERVELSYRAIDETFATRLYNDLDLKLLDFCNNFLNETCGLRTPINVILSADAETLVEIGSLTDFLSTNGTTITLPSPTLVGRPIDDAGYRALLAGYTEKIVAALMADVVQYRCCIRIAYFKAIVDRQMADLGLRPPPITAADYQVVINLGFPLEANLKIWEITSERAVSADQERIVAATLAYFFDRDSTLTNLDLLSTMMSAEGGFRSWQSSLLPVDSLTDRFNQFEAVESEDWQRFVIENAQAADVEPPVPYPDEQLMVACSAESGSALYGLDFAEQTWEPTYTTPGSALFAVNLPGDDAFGLYEFVDDTNWTTSLWLDGVSYPYISADGVNENPFWVYNGASADKLVLADGNLSPGQPNRSVFIDWRACALDGECDQTHLTGNAVWSPNGEYALVVEAEPGQLSGAHTNLIDDEGTIIRQAFPTTGLLVWLDAERYALISASGNTYSPNVFAGHVAADDTTLLLSLNDLRDAIPTASRDRLLSWVDLAPVPGNSAELLIIAQSWSPTNYLLLRYNTETAKATLLYESTQPLQMPVGADRQRLSESVSADNRFVFFNSGLRPTYELLLLDTTDDGITSYGNAFQPQWIGDWLVDLDDNYLRLLLPAHSFQQFTPLPATDCITMAWTK